MEPKNSDPAAVYFIKCLIKRYIDDDVGSFASEASYCFILGLIPFMIFLVNCILFFAAPQLDTILDLLQYLPAQFAASMEENIARIIAGRSTIWLFAGLGGAVWTASQGTAVLVRGMDKIFFQDRNIQSWLKVSLKACFFTIFLVQDYIMELPSVFWQVWRPSRYAIPFVVMSLSLSAFYRYAPNRYITKWTRIIPASFLVAAALLFLTAGYGYYILHISGMGVTYGSLIGLIFLFLWIHLAVQIILAGGAVIMAWEDMRHRRL